MTKGSKEHNDIRNEKALLLLKQDVEMQCHMKNDSDALMDHYLEGVI